MVAHDPTVSCRDCACPGCVAVRAIPADRAHTFIAKVNAGTTGHLADPGGSGRGRWLATPVRMWSERDGIDRREYLR